MWFGHRGFLEIDVRGFLHRTHPMSHRSWEWQILTIRVMSVPLDSGSKYGRCNNWPVTVKKG